MIGLDTNVLLRWLAGHVASLADDPEQAELAAETVSASRERLFVNHIVLAESAWVLRNKAGYSKQETLRILERLVTAVNVALDRPEMVEGALAGSREGPGDFTDHLIGRINQAAGCSTTLTYDRNASRLPSFFTRLTR